MTVTNPPFCLQAGSHSAQLFRDALCSLIDPAGGLIAADDLQVVQNGTPNMSVNVGAGRAWVPGTSLASINPGADAYYPQGLYFCENDAAVNVPVSASDPSLPRVDTVILQVQDSEYAGSTNSAGLAVVTGTPTAGATLANLSGAGTIPVSSLVLAHVLVPANASSIVTADIGNAAIPLITGLDQWRIRLNPAANLTAASGDWLITSSGITVTLPAAFVGARVRVTAGSAVASSAPVTVAVSGLIYAQGASGVSSIVLGAPMAFVELVSYDGANWVTAAGQQDTGWVTVGTFTNSWAQYASGQTVAYRLVGDRVYLRGQMFGGASGTSAFTLPAGYRPTVATALVSGDGSTGAVLVTSIGTAGTVSPRVSATGDIADLLVQSFSIL